MTYQHDAHLANIVTSYCTCLAGVMPLLFTALGKRHPARWIFAYFCILLTGIPTVWLHTVEGNRVASFFDVGSNIFLAWALLVAVSGDFMRPRARGILLAVVTVLNGCAWAWLVYEIGAPEKVPLLTFGEFGQFYVGECALIANCWIVAGVFFAYRRRITRKALGLLYLVIAMFLIGMFLATASNSTISFGILPWHATWHIVGAFGFIAMWVFNDVRFNEATRVGAPMPQAQ
ncbi:MAG TPA: hypothetical protein PLO37_26075 [Candidatus Hydrogenedentes bacterium]|nr:hypothetical protein [Candidatus Hydrogenedentota bacterium]HPG70323.1 hypothetical protein [Candidatus Hydrogenedentota bacterium]